MENKTEESSNLIFYSAFVAIGLVLSAINLFDKEIKDVYSDLSAGISTYVAREFPKPQPKPPQP